jgi:hypothetical protein
MDDKMLLQCDMCTVHRAECHFAVCTCNAHKERAPRAGESAILHSAHGMRIRTGEHNISNFLKKRDEQLENSVVATSNTNICMGGVVNHT